MHRNRLFAAKRRFFYELALANMFVALLPIDVYAYIDPGTTGMLSQLLYVLFYGALGVLLYSIRYLKNMGGQLGEYVRKIFKTNR